MPLFHCGAQLIAKALRSAILGVSLNPSLHLHESIQMNIDQVIQELYRSNIDCGVETFFGSGVTAWVVDANNRRLEKQFAVDDFASIAAWLLSESVSVRQRADRNAGSNVGSLVGELGGSVRKPAVRVSAHERDARRNSTDERLQATND